MPSIAMSLMSTTPPANGPLAPNGEPGSSARWPKRSYMARRCGSRQDLVARVDLLEADRRLRVVRILVRMMLDASLRKATLISSWRRVLADAEDLVVVPRHRSGICRVGVAHGPPAACSVLRPSLVAVMRTRQPRLSPLAPVAEHGSCPTWMAPATPSPPRPAVRRAARAPARHRIVVRCTPRRRRATAPSPRPSSSSTSTARSWTTGRGRAVILHELAPSVAPSTHPRGSRRAGARRAERSRYLLTDTLARLGITDSERVAEAQAFWKERFFADDHLDARRRRSPARSSSRKACYDAGAILVYLTGRDLPLMGLGSFRSLRDLGFPIGVPGTELVLKPDATMPDEAFKRLEAPKLARVGAIVASFDNEPGNCNTILRAEPRVRERLRRHAAPAGRAAARIRGVHVVADFRRGVIVRAPPRDSAARARVAARRAAAVRAPVNDAPTRGRARKRRPSPRRSRTSRVTSSALPLDARRGPAAGAAPRGRAEAVGPIRPGQGRPGLGARGRRCGPADIPAGVPRHRRRRSPRSTRRKKRTEPRLTIDLAAARTRASPSASGGFVLARGHRAPRADRSLRALRAARRARASYRIAAPGALRALFGERRLDVDAARAPAERLAERGDGAAPPRLPDAARRRDEPRGRRRRSSSRTSPRPATAGVLLCRMLLDLMNAPPSTPVCALDEVPLHVEIRWTTKGGLVVRRDRARPSARSRPRPSLAAPPSSASFAHAVASPTFGRRRSSQRAELTALPHRRPSTLRLPRPTARAPPSRLGPRPRQPDRSSSASPGSTAPPSPGSRRARTVALPVAPPRSLRLRLAHVPRRRVDAPITIAVPATISAGRSVTRGRRRNRQSAATSFA